MMEVNRNTLTESIVNESNFMPSQQNSWAAAEVAAIDRQVRIIN